MLYIMVNEDRPDGQAIRAATRETHLAYLERHKNIVVLAGGTLADDGSRTGSVFLINVPSREAAEKFSAEEPFRKAGLFQTVKITRMRRGQWHPQNAPRSEEGS
ncbi:MAG TPA: YciI family protein [Burkholderiales bacterium]